jgi:hypothetical protein
MRYIYAIVFVICNMHGFAQTNSTPYYLDPLRDGIMGGAGFVTATFSSVFKPPAHMLFLDPDEIGALDREQVNSFDRWAINNYRPNLNKTSKAFTYFIGASAIATLVAMPVYSSSTENLYLDAGVLAVIYAEGLLYSQGLAAITNTYIVRPKPFVYNKDLPIEWRVQALNDISFFSGRSSFVFYNAMFITCVSNEYFKGSPVIPWLSGAAFFVAGTISAFEVAAGERFLSDVLTGAAVGTLSAFAITQLHLKKYNSNFSFIPVASPWYTGLSCSLKI